MTDSLSEVHFLHNLQTYIDDILLSVEIIHIDPEGDEQVHASHTLHCTHSRSQLKAR